MDDSACGPCGGGNRPQPPAWLGPAPDLRDVVSRRVAGSAPRHGLSTCLLSADGATQEGAVDAWVPIRFTVTVTDAGRRLACPGYAVPPVSASQ